MNGNRVGKWPEQGRSDGIRPIKEGLIWFPLTYRHGENIDPYTVQAWAGVHPSNQPLTRYWVESLCKEYREYSSIDSLSSDPYLSIVAWGRRSR